VILDPPGNPAECGRKQASACFRKVVRNMSATILPTFNGYTVDIRLKEFRKFIPGELPEFIPFSSPEGEKLFRELEVFALQVAGFIDYD
jgi:hypothetical protein